jgi:glutamine amidotransferase
MSGPGASVPVTIVDAGVGNLANVARALAAAGGAPCVTRDRAQVATSHRLVLPGVGAFRPPREALRGEVEAALRTALDGGAELLGICVGYQLLFEESDEFGVTDGLALLPGRVAELPADVQRPHVGWNRLDFARRDPLFEGLDDGTEVYFVHSFAPAEVPAGVALATTLHGRDFAAAAASGRIAGVQFHPEKSGEAGLRLLANFLAGAGSKRAARATGATEIA